MGSPRSFPDRMLIGLECLSIVNRLTSHTWLIYVEFWIVMGILVVRVAVVVVAVSRASEMTCN